jgi:hypothetical protein
VRRGLLDPRQERCCVFCFRDDETSQHFLSHLFLAEFGVAYLTGLVFKGLWCIIVSCILSAIWLVNKKVKIKKETIHSMDGRSLVYMDEQEQDNI